MCTTSLVAFLSHARPVYANTGCFIFRLAVNKFVSRDKQIEAQHFLDVITDTGSACSTTINCHLLQESLLVVGKKYAKYVYFSPCVPREKTYK